MDLVIRIDHMIRSCVWLMVCASCTSSHERSPDATWVSSDAAVVAGDAGGGPVGMDASIDAGRHVDAGQIADASSSSDAGPDCLGMEPGYAKQRCLKPWIQDLTRRRGAAEALCAAEDLLEQGEVSDCHLLAHFVGEVVFEQQGGDAAQSLIACPATCLSGCGHQVM